MYLTIFRALHCLYKHMFDNQKSVF